jgi:hypothetical protein
MEPKRIILEHGMKLDSILLSEPVLNPVTLNMLHGSGDLITLQDIEALQAVHTIEYVMGIALQKNVVSRFFRATNRLRAVFFRPFFVWTLRHECRNVWRFVESKIFHYASDPSGVVHRRGEHFYCDV